jgi:hypothetical protein
VAEVAVVIAALLEAPTLNQEVQEAGQDKMVPLRVLAFRHKVITAVARQVAAVAVRVLRVQYLQEELALLHQSQALQSHGLAVAAAGLSVLLRMQVAQVVAALALAVFLLL